MSEPIKKWIEGEVEGIGKWRANFVIWRSGSEYIVSIDIYRGLLDYAPAEVKEKIRGTEEFKTTFAWAEEKRDRLSKAQKIEDDLVKIRSIARQIKMIGLRKRIEAGEGTPCFIRFGKVPKDERSWNHKDNHPEPGVSAYPAHKLSDREFVVDLSDIDSISARFIFWSAPAYVLKGDVVGTGSDGEPLLRNCKARKLTDPTIHTII